MLFPSTRTLFLEAATFAMVLVGCGSPDTPSHGDLDADNAEIMGNPMAELANLSVASREDVQASSDDWFEDVTDQSGVQFAYSCGRETGHNWLVEAIGGGVAMIDYDQDGDLDLFFAGGGRIDGDPPSVSGVPGKLYRNDGNWRFIDVTEEAGLSQARDFSFGVAVGDVDRDGFSDLFVTCYRQSRLYRNDKQGSFEDITVTAGISLDGINTGAVFADFDRDGRPDLFAVGYLQVQGNEDKNCLNELQGVRDLCGPWDFPAVADRLFRNEGDLTFTDVTEESGVKAEGKGLAVLAGDINEDGWVDFFVANDTSLNYLYYGGPHLPFTEAALPAGIAASEQGAPEGSMGVDYGDYDGDGLGDFWFTNYQAEDNALCRRGVDGTFARVTLSAKLGSGRPFVGFGTGFADFDSDGWLDLVVSNGHVFYHSEVGTFLQAPLLYRNRAGRDFIDISKKGGPYFQQRHPGRGLAIGDLDDDGAPDVVVVHQNGPATLLRNRNCPKHWFRLKLTAVQTEPSAIGARVSMEFQGRTLVRHVRAGAGYLSHSDQRILFPAEDEQRQIATVYWPSGKVETFPLQKTCREYQLIEGNGS